MSTDAVQDRRAAYAALLPVLGREEALQALALLPGSLLSGAVSEVIGYVDAVARQHGMDDGTRRRLYASLFATLRLPAARLPDDPLAEVNPAAEAAHAPSPWAGIATPRTSGMAGARTDALGRVPAEQVVFGAVMQHLVEQLQAHHGTALMAVREAALTEFSRARVMPVTREMACAAWHQQQAGAWRIAGPVEELAELVHRTYLALCRALGPMEADMLLTHAARHAAELPEAQDCPPGRLL